MVANRTSMFIDTPDIGNLVIAMNSHVGYWMGHSLLIIFFVILILSLGTRSWNNFAVACYISFIVSILLFVIDLIPMLDVVILFIFAAAFTALGFMDKSYN